MNSEANVALVEESRIFNGRPNVSNCVTVNDIFSHNNDHVDVWVNGGNSFRIDINSRGQIDEQATRVKLEELADEVSSAVAEAVRKHVEKCLVFH